MGVFYPKCVFICAGILLIRLANWKKINFGLSQQKNDYIFCGFGLGVAFVVMLPYALKASEFAPVITLQQAKQLPELFPGGRSVFFNDNPLIYFLGDGRGGMFSPWLVAPITLVASFFLPFIIRSFTKLPLIQKLTGEIVILPQILITSVMMFIAAHILLFRLYLPSRYVGFTYRIMIVIAAAIVLTTVLDYILLQASIKDKKHPIVRQLFALVFGVFFIAITLFYYPCLIKHFPKTGYIIGHFPQLYKFFQQQPKDTLIASLAGEADNLPTFSQRSVLVAREYAIPWHFGYYSKFRQLTTELIQATYSPNLADTKNLIQKYGIDFWLLEPETFSPEYIKKNKSKYFFFIIRYYVL